MPANAMAAKLAHHFARFAAAGGAAASGATHGTSNSFRFAFNNAAASASGSAGGASSAGAAGGSAGWAAGLSSSAGSASGGAGMGGAKFHAGRGAFQSSGRALANANVAAHDGSASLGEDDEETRRGTATIPPLIVARRSQADRRFLGASHMGPTSGIHNRITSTFSLQRPSVTLLAAEGEPKLHARALSTSTAKAIEAADAKATSVEQSSSASNVATATSSSSLLQQDLDRAREQGDHSTIRDLVERLRSLPKASQSTASYNAAMEALLSTKASSEAISRDVTELYVRMIDNDCAPNRASFSAVVRALCRKDVQLYRQRRRGKDDSFAQALELLSVASASSQTPQDLSTFNAVLRSCAVRGNSTRATKILDTISASELTPDADTFRHLITCFGNDSRTVKDEEPEKAKARKVGACTEVFKQFRQERQHRLPEGFGASKELGVFSAYLRALFALDQPAKAIGVLEELLSDPSLPVPDASISTAIIDGFLSSNDVASAASWFDRITQSTAAAAGGEARTLPMPWLSTLDKLVSELNASIDLAELYQSKDETKGASKTDPAALLPAIRAANAALSFVYGKAGLEGFTVRFAVLNETLRRNAALADFLGQSQPEIASQLLDASLSHIQRHYELFGDSAHPIVDGEKPLEPEELADLTRAFQHNVRSIISVLRILVAHDRLADAGAAFTYAVFAMPELPWASSDAAAVPVNENVVKALLAELHSVAAAIAEGPSHAVALAAACEYVIPSLRELSNIPSRVNARVIELWRTLRKDQSLAELELSQRALSHLLDAVAVEENSKEEKSLEALKSNGLGLLLSDLAALPQEQRPDLASSLALNVLTRHYGSEAVSIIESYDADLATRLAPQRAPASPSGEATASSAGSDSGAAHLSSGSTAATPPLSPIYSAKPAAPIPVEEQLALPPAYTAPPPGFDAPVPGLPEVAIIDTDLGATLERRMRVRRPDPARALQDAEQVLEQIRTTVALGTYPSPEPIPLLLNVFGRAGRLEVVRELGAIATQVIAGLGGEPEWQLRSWVDFEDAMICALAHGGEPEAASAHRHRLIAGGHAPSANAYAALIATMRDTTDDALVAEELFEEAQRLGVLPNVYLYNTVISRLSRARKADRALQLFDEMVQSPLRLRPTSVTYGALINACTRVGDETNAVRLFERMEQDPSVKIAVPPLNSMIQFYTYTVPNRERALAYYAKLVELGLKPSHHTYRLLLDVHGSIAPVEAERMDEIFNELADKGLVQGTHWASLITAHGIHAKDLDKAMAIFDSIASHPSTARSVAQAMSKAGGATAPLPDAVCFEALLNVLLEHGRFDLASEHLERFRTSANVPLTAYVANVVIRGYSMQGSRGLQTARDIFEEMQDPPTGLAAQGNHPAAGHRHHAGGAASGGGAEAGAGAQNPSAEGSHGFAGVQREPSTWEAAIRAEVINGEKQRARELVERMHKRAFPPAIVLRAQAILDEEPVGVGSGKAEGSD